MSFNHQDILINRWWHDSCTRCICYSNYSIHLFKAEKKHLVFQSYSRWPHNVINIGTNMSYIFCRQINHRNCFYLNILIKKISVWCFYACGPTVIRLPETRVNAGCKEGCLSAVLNINLSTHFAWYLVKFLRTWKSLQNLFPEDVWE